MKNLLRYFTIGMSGGFVGAAILYLLLYFTKAPFKEQPTAELQNTASQTHLARHGTRVLLNEDFVEASAISTPSVVYIKTVARSRQSMDLFDLYFGDGWRSDRVLSSGSGVIFTSDGYIVTNNHVIEDAEEVEVIHNKQTFEAEIIGTDPSSDLAILKIKAKNLPNIKLGRSRNVQVGEWVLAVGNPFNLTSTVTAGIVSAKGRNINLLGGQFPIESFIQTDAAINPGNSGGALVNLSGELIGINTAILSRTGTYTGYGFAVPVDIVAKIVNDLIQFGEVQKAFLGAEVKDINTDIAEEYNLAKLDGVVITGVLEGSAADKIGLVEGDVILKVNEEEINARAEYDEQLSYLKPGDKVNIAYRKKGALLEKQATLTNREGTTGVIKRKIFSANRLGVELEAISKVERDKLNLNNGIRIAKLRRGFFSRMGVNEGFIITKINGQMMEKPEDVVTTLEQYEKQGGRVVMEGISASGRKGYYSFYF
ncbi:MAG: S1C family serine protease [Thermonemataceae bacterium]